MRRKAEVVEVIMDGVLAVRTEVSEVIKSLNDLSKGIGLSRGTIFLVLSAYTDDVIDFDMVDFDAKPAPFSQRVVIHGPKSNMTGLIAKLKDLCGETANVMLEPEVNVPQDPQTARRLITAEASLWTDFLRDNSEQLSSAQCLVLGSMIGRLHEVASQNLGIDQLEALGDEITPYNVPIDALYPTAKAIARALRLRKRYIAILTAKTS